MMSKGDRERGIAGLEQLLESVPQQANFQMTKGFRLRVGKKWKTGYRSYNQYHMLYMRDGYGKYYINDECYDLFPGRIIFLSNGIPHQTEHELKTAPVITTSFFDKIDNFSGEIQISEEPFYLVTKEEGGSNIGALFDEIFALFQSEDSQLIQNRISLTIGRILHEIHDFAVNEASFRSNNTDRSVEKIIRFIRQNPSERSNIEELAKQVGMTADYFSRLFKKHTGQSLKKFQVEIRLNYAKNLLQHTNLRVSEVAYQLSYPDPYLFSRQFKAKYGYSPQNLKK